VALTEQRMKKIFAAFCALIVQAVALSLRIHRVDRGRMLAQPRPEPIIIVFWHNRLFLMPAFFWRYRRRGHGRTALTLISRSRDGQVISDIASWFGIRAARGSSSRHGASAALVALRGAKDESIDIVVTPDGPRGPRYRVQPGVLRIAQATGRPIVSITTYVRWKIELKSWDRFQVPLPFSRCELVTGEPIFVPPFATAAELEELTDRLARSLGGDEPALRES
jgi:lysophospholipid acyltransferase (LPLAT)-like uncharacterized protein